METKAILNQSRFLCGKRKFSLTYKKEVAVQYLTLFRKEKYTVSIFELDHKPMIVHYKAYHWAGLATTFAYFWLTYLGSYIPIFEGSSAHERLYFIIPTVICLVLYRVKSYDLVSFNYYQTREPALLLWENNPSDVAYEQFYELVTEEIKNTQISPEMSDQDKLEIYSKHLDLLVSESVISEIEAREILERTVSKIRLNQSPSSMIN